MYLVRKLYLHLVPCIALMIQKYMPWGGNWKALQPVMSYEIFTSLEALALTSQREREARDGTRTWKPPSRSDINPLVSRLEEIGQVGSRIWRVVGAAAIYQLLSL